MDESTSALDADTEKEIVEEIGRLKGNLTIIVIAHRETTLKHCDRIYEMSKGHIIGDYNYHEIKNNTYKKCLEFLDYHSHLW